MSDFQPSDYTLEWPRDVFVAVAEGLLASRETFASFGAWSDVVELLLTEAFVDDHVADAFRNNTLQGELPADWLGEGPVVDPLPLVRALVAHVDSLPTATERTYWSERRTGQPPRLNGEAVRTGFVHIVEEMYANGYFDSSMPKGCVDEPGSFRAPDEVLSLRIGRAGLWPLRNSAGAWDDDTFFDLIEVFHDLATRTRYRRRWHPWNNCGWHFDYPDRRSGQLVYRWRVNALLGRSDLGYRLATEGEDVGRLVAVTGDARDDLADSMVSGADPETGDRVVHSVALFRGRAATEHDKRSAVVALAGVLEERRQLLKADLLTKDEAALFEIANRFSIRHQSEMQKTDYDPVFLDWVFWWYLATIDLTDRLIIRQEGSDQTP